MEDFLEDNIAPDGEGCLTIKFQDLSEAGHKVNLSKFSKQAVTELVISFSCLEKLPQGTLSLKYLRCLDISNNNISVLPPEIGTLKYLTDLEVSNNALTALPAQIVHCEKLSNINLARNNLKDIPVGLFGKRYLQGHDHGLSIDVSENDHLAMIPKDLRDIEQSEAVLWLLNVYFTHEEEISFVHKCTLDVKNHIDRVKDEIKELERKSKHLHEQLDGLKGDNNNK